MQKENKKKHTGGKNNINKRKKTQENSKKWKNKQCITLIFHDKLKIARK